MIDGKLNDTFSEISDEISRLRAIEKDYNEIYDVLFEGGFMLDNYHMTKHELIMDAISTLIVNFDC